MIRMQPVVATRKTTNFHKKLLKLIHTLLSFAHTISKMISSGNILLIFKLTLPVVSTISIARSLSVNAT
jgi:hypothetical protein